MDASRCRRRGAVLSVLACAWLSASLGGLAWAQAVAGQPDIKSLDDLIGLIPKEAARDIDKKSKQEDAARAISEALRNSAFRKTATFDLVLDFWQPWGERGTAAYRLKPLLEERKEKGVRFRIGMWIMAPRDSGPVIEKLKKGDKFEVTGQLTRADFTVSEGPTLHLDVEDATVTVKK